jgi:hypothetical protein
MTRLFLISLAAAAGLWPCVLAAQSPQAPNEGVQVGDRWVFDTKDEISGLPKDTLTRIVTEISDKEIVTETYVRGKPGKALVIFDRDWDLVDNLAAKYKPNDGQGARLPLAVGKTWRSEFDQKINQSGASFHGSVFAKVTGQESRTTEAGTFDTFKIEFLIKQFQSSDPSKLWDIQTIKWYAPQVNHWVRETSVMNFDKRTRSSTSAELVDFSRKF